MRGVRVLSSLAVSLLALAVVAWVAEQPGRALRAPASSTERGEAAIGSGYTLHAVTADRPRLVAVATRAQGRTIVVSPPSPVVHDPGRGLASIGVLDGSATTTPPAGFVPSLRAPPSPPSG